MIGLFKRLRKEEQGAAIIEFAFVLTWISAIRLIFAQWCRVRSTMYRARAR